MTKQSIVEKLHYRFDRIMSKGTRSLILLLGVISVIVVFVVAIFIVVFGIRPENVQNLPFEEAFWLSLMRTLDPGTMGDDTGWLFRISMLAITLFGVVALSVFIGLVSNGILLKLGELRKGRSFVMEKDHVLILGWSSKIYTIISELIQANENQKKATIVILAEKDKIEMEDEIAERIGATGVTKIICRTGNPIDISDLYIANPNESKSIIVLDKENQDSDSQIIKTILAITANPKRREKKYHIVAEIEDRKNMEVAKIVGKDEVELVLSDDFISRITVQTSRQSGLSVVYTDLLDFEGDEIYFEEEKKLIGKSFNQALLSYEDSAVIGLQRVDGSIELPPAMNTKIENGDKIIAISRDDDTIIVADNYRPVIQFDLINHVNNNHQGKENILILGWNRRAGQIIRELDNYCMTNSLISVIADVEEPAVIAQINNEVKNTSISFQKADTTDRYVLQELELNKYDHLLLLSYQDFLNHQEADARTLITLLHLRNMASEEGRGLNIVSEMLDSNNRELAKVTNADDFIISDNILGLLMTQVAENKHLMQIFESLFRADGYEVYLKPAKNYVVVGESMNFYTVVESAIQKNQIAIGYRLMRYKNFEKKAYGIVLNPVKSTNITFEEEDKIIVLSES